ncbi:MAG: amidase family protein [Solirubrobacterales bacterium]
MTLSHSPFAPRRTMIIRPGPDRCRRRRAESALGWPAVPAVAAPPRSDHLTERSALELAAAIRERKLTARDVVEAHIALIEERNAAVNALVATRFGAARAEADEADRLLGSRRGRKDPPPLLGVPCTIKESFAVAGMPHTSGSVARRGLGAPRAGPPASSASATCPTPSSWRRAAP